MRVSVCETRFPFYFCKPSSHLCTSSNLNGSGNGNGNVNHSSSKNGLKSSLRKASPDPSLVEKKKVQWADVFGKQLAEIKEFESSEDEDTNYRCLNNRRCVCTIL